MMQNLSLPAPEYRAFELMDALPDGCIAFPVTDQYSMPHLRPGEVAVVDTMDTTPRNNDVFVIEWETGGRTICQARSRQARWKGAVEGDTAWMVGAIRNPRPHQVDAVIAHCIQTGRQYPGWTDGPLTFEHLRSKLVGRVIGIFDAKLEGPMRVVSPEA